MLRGPSAAETENQVTTRPRETASSLEGGTRRAIDIHEGEKGDARAFKALVKAAVDHNGESAKKR